MDRTRRTLCQAGLALGCAAALPACGGSSNSNNGGSCDESDLAVGLASSIALNDAVKVLTAQANGTGVFVCHDAGGYYAVDAGCTHVDCDVALKAPGDLSQGFLCPCHGATYDANGLNPTTPAPLPLPHYELCLQSSGELVCNVSPSDPVAATVRLKA